VTAYKRIAVLMGGRSAEREVSLSSGRGVMQALAEEGFDPVSIDPGDNPGQQLFDARPDAVFNALHGRFGEDGTVQGLLELMRLPYTHSGVLSSALAMHKERTKDIYRAAGLPVVKSIVADRREPATGGAVGGRLEYFRRDDGGGIRPRPRTHRGGDGRQASWRDRDHHRTGILRLRSQVCARRIEAHPARQTVQGDR
jgi:hypothetical protein